MVQLNLNQPVGHGVFGPGGLDRVPGQQQDEVEEVVGEVSEMVNP